MNKSIVTPNSGALSAETLDHCRYCGCPLLEQFYFCVGCGMPYKSVALVLSPSIPVPPTTGKLIELKAPRVWPLFWSYFAVVVGAAVLGALINPHDITPLIIINALALLSLTAVWGSMHWRSLAVQFKRPGFTSGWAWLCLAGLPVALGINFAWHGFLSQYLPEEPGSEFHSLEQALGRGGVIVFICVLPAVLEEIAFRGLLQHWLQVALGPMMALVLASALFVVLHFSIVSAPYLMVVGLLLGLAKLKTGSLYPSILIHFLHNLAVVEFVRAM
jgi:membrane protease YdiL (CAAX protease family)